MPRELVAEPPKTKWVQILTTQGCKVNGKDHDIHYTFFIVRLVGAFKYSNFLKEESTSGNYPF